MSHQRIKRNCEGLGRRDFIQTGLGALGGLGLTQMLGMRASATGALFFEDVVVPEENMLPGSTIGLKAPLSCLTQARFGITWGVIGAAQACLAQVIDYTKTRELFGRPLAQNQAIQIRLAEMARSITGAQLMSLQLGRLKDAGSMHPAQVSLAKWNNCRMAIDIARDDTALLNHLSIGNQLKIRRQADQLFLAEAEVVERDREGRDEHRLRKARLLLQHLHDTPISSECLLARRTDAIQWKAG